MPNLAQQRQLVGRMILFSVVLVLITGAGLFLYCSYSYAGREQVVDYAEQLRRGQEAARQQEASPEGQRLQLERQIKIQKSQLADLLKEANDLSNKPVVTPAERQKVDSLCQQIIERGEKTAPPEMLARCYLLRGGFAMWQDSPKRDFETATRMFSRAADLYRDTKSTEGLAQSLQHLGQCLRPDCNPAVRKFDEAIAALQEAAALYRKTGSRIDCLNCEYELAQCVSPEINSASSWEDMAAHYSKICVDYKADESPKIWMAACAGHALATEPGLNPKGDWEKAGALHERALAMAKALPDAACEARESAHLARCLSHTDQRAEGFARRIELLNRAVELTMKFNRPGWAGECLEQLGDEYEDTSNPDRDFQKAANYYEQAARLLRDPRQKARLSHCLHEVAWWSEPIHNPRGSWEKAISFYKQALEVKEADEKRDIYEYSKTLHNLGLCLMPERNSKGDWDKAADYFGRAAIERATAGEKEMQGISLWRAAYCMNRGQWSNMSAQARKIAEQAKLLAPDFRPEE